METNDPYDFLDSTEYNYEIKRAKDIFEQYLDDPFKFTCFRTGIFDRNNEDLLWLYIEFHNNDSISDFISEEENKCERLVGEAMSSTRSFLGLRHFNRRRLKTNLKRGEYLYPTEEELVGDLEEAKKIFDRVYKNFLERHGLL